ncbi:hypothetical protein L1987_64197 [Smallanthus sonchifolius]|uniref:Uncharacterized protein n=1 Tax=Smallanthus sonchifolius TaxID=185202 RepID=A0ACB9CFA6_9ASTR|nr:hypothetical protein L1987_64197 [Smallanthus sonchifolius]
MRGGITIIEAVTAGMAIQTEMLIEDLIMIVGMMIIKDVEKISDIRDASGYRSSRDKHKRDDFRDEKRSGYHHKDSSWRDSDDPKYSRFEKGKSYDQETRGGKDRYFKEPKQLLDDENVVTAKKSKFSMILTPMTSSSSKQGKEVVGKANTEQDFVKDSDIDVLGFSGDLFV